MSVLQLRRFLRAVGQPTAGLKPALTARLEHAMSSGAVKAFVDGARAQPCGEVECGEQSMCNHIQDRQETRARACLRFATCCEHYGARLDAAMFCFVEKIEAEEVSLSFWWPGGSPAYFSSFPSTSCTIPLSLSHAHTTTAGERRKTETMLAMAENMLNLDGGAAGPPAPAADKKAPKLPLRESVSSANNERNSRSSAGSSAADKDRAQVQPLQPPPQQQQAPATPTTSKLLSGQEQDAVVAKIRSAAKRSASPEKKLPYQDDDTPNTKGARHKKEMEVCMYLKQCSL